MCAKRIHFKQLYILQFRMRDSEKEYDTRGLSASPYIIQKSAKAVVEIMNTIK